MPIVINEIEINVTVTSSPTTASTTSDNVGSSKEAIVRECVEKVLEIINQKNER